MKLISSAFRDGERIPKAYTGEGRNVSPPLEWNDPPDDTRSFALLCEDPDAPQEEPWVHWVAYGIPADVTAVVEGVEGLTEGKNSRGAIGYDGPMPPPGHGPHHYHFKAYALDAPIDLEPGASKKKFLEAVEGHVLAIAELVGIYER